MFTSALAFKARHCPFKPTIGTEKWQKRFRRDDFVMLWELPAHVQGYKGLKSMDGEGSPPPAAEKQAAVTGFHTKQHNCCHPCVWTAGAA